MCDASHGRGIICTRRGFRDPYDGKCGLDDLLDDYGSKNFEARCAITRGDLCRVVDAVSDEPGRVGEVEDLEEACCEPVCGDWCDNGQERV